ncbi:transcriptional regulator, HxlR family [Lentzea xinjiangensis]|uniref:Transcriptional regulator, HxlR family n=1 Tax=Lentzea xinjiangensis TaxID=402600 RepID=A0A1H9V0Y7_9PSEU|nr:helix-turn-helix domain-containing protein [Lentzea xinjiangensis]SES15440.1 transcriptional regulator, HxlR family [Lentzea xinjiangensis]
MHQRRAHDPTEVADPAWNRDAWLLEPDSVQRALDVLVPRSAGQVVREAFYGTRRFDDFRRHTGLTPGVLSARLRDLTDQGILIKVAYHDTGSRGRHEYRLTDKGRDLAAAIISLLNWADHWLPAPGGPTVVLTHRDCGAPIRTQVRCAHDHPVDSLGDIQAAPGPGARIRE